MSAPLEVQLGLEVFSTKTPGVNGVIKQLVEDFIVEEITPEGIILKSKIWNEPEPTFSEVVGDQIHFTLEKFDWDTLRAIQFLAKKLYVSKKRFGFAGTKDKRAISVQQISTWNIDLERLEQLSIKGLEIRNIRKSDKRIQLGDLQGNRFTITIRNIDLSCEETKTYLEKITEEIAKNNGVPNFFGVQRFGTRRPVTHLVGYQLIKGNIKEAVLVYLSKWFPTEGKESIEARKFLEENPSEFKVALEKFPSRLKYERTLLAHLSEKPNDFCGALRKLPRSLLKMFVHAYQSYLFNRILSKRIRRQISPCEAQIGDVICTVSPNGLPDRKTLTEVTGSNLEEVNNLVKSNQALITAPLIGYFVPLSKGELGQIERKILDDEKIQPKDFQIKSLPEASSKGERREILLRVRDLKILKVDEDDKNSGKAKAVIQFILPKGCYATTVLREYLKAQNLIQYG
ncbi:MAG: tRNA pseudouridine(13) synthase TruD [Euryarchaeota archaeon]|nr:tRNA pseudouridine(13) synthase TruD [Euryarchaeota archaeon]